MRAAWPGRASFEWRGRRTSVRAVLGVALRQGLPDLLPADPPAAHVHSFGRPPTPAAGQHRARATRLTSSISSKSGLSSSLAACKQGVVGSSGGGDWMPLQRRSNTAGTAAAQRGAHLGYAADHELAAAGPACQARAPQGRRQMLVAGASPCSCNAVSSQQAGTCRCALDLATGPEHREPGCEVGHTDGPGLGAQQVYGGQPDARLLCDLPGHGLLHGLALHAGLGLWAGRQLPESSGAWSAAPRAAAGTAFALSCCGHAGQEPPWHGARSDHRRLLAAVSRLARRQPA